MLNKKELIIFLCAFFAFILMFLLNIFIIERDFVKVNESEFFLSKQTIETISKFFEIIGSIIFTTFLCLRIKYRKKMDNTNNILILEKLVKISMVFAVISQYINIIVL
jgi:hypothetical protein